MRKTLFGSIQSRLLVALLMSAAFAVLLVGIFSFSIQNQLEEEADARLLATARNVSENLEQFHQRNLQSFEMAARMPQLEAFIEADETQRSDEKFREATFNTLASTQLVPWNQFYTLSFAILDTNGINILDTNNSNVGTDESLRPYFQQPLVTGLAYTSELYYLNSRTGVYYYYLVPIRRHEAPNPVIGLLRGEVSVSSLQNLLLNLAMQEQYRDLDIMLFDEHLVRLVDTQRNDHIFSTIRDYSQQELNELIANELLPNMPVARLIQPVNLLAQALGTMDDTAVFTASSYPNQSAELRIAALRLPFNELNWFLAVGKPTGEFYLPIQRQTLGLFVLSSVLMIGAVAISLLISRSVTVPIRQLTAVAQQVAEGKLDVQATIYSKDEIGTLAETFNQMTSELRHIKSNLENLVEERTQNLKETNANLTREIAERERLQAQNIHMALEAERTRILSEFIQDASHEFKTPLSIINVKAHLLKRLTEEKLHPYLRDIEEQSHHIEVIVSAMVLLSKLDSMTELTLTPVYVDDFLRSVFELENAAFEKLEILLHLELHARTASIAINPEMMRESLRQILENARDFTPESGMVIIQSDSDPLFVEIRVQDTGIGMNQEVLSHAFERFYRGDTAHTTRGFGLGLPIAKRIIELSGGTIRIESEVMNGTTVIIRLPRSEETPKMPKRMDTDEFTAL